MEMTKEASKKLEQASQLIAIALDLIQNTTLYISEHSVKRIIPTLTGLPEELATAAQMEETSPHSPIESKE